MSVLYIKDPATGKFVAVPNISSKAPVQSVNGKTGAVQLTADDVGAASNEDVNKAIEDAIDAIGGTVEVTSGLPQKAQTVLTVDPSGVTVNLYTAEEIDGMVGGLSEEKADKFTVGEGLMMDGDVLEVVPEPELELIETIVCNGTYGNVSRSNLSLKRVVLYIHTQAATAATSVGIEVRNEKEMFGYAWIGNGINTAERWMYANAVSGGKQAAYIETTNPSTSKYTSTMLNRTPSRYDGDTPITRINVYASSGSMLPADSTIEIWGVRA